MEMIWIVAAFAAGVWCGICLMAILAIAKERE